MTGSVMLVPSFWQALVLRSMQVKFQQLHCHSLKFPGLADASLNIVQIGACNKSIGSDCLRQPAMQALAVLSKKIMNGLNDISEIERLKILKSISTGCREENDLDSYIYKFAANSNPEEVKRRLKGLHLEDEFLLLCRIMQCSDSINGIEQGISIENGFKVPDYIASFRANKSLYRKQKSKNINAFIEVKTSEKNETKKIGKGFLDKYKKYSDQYGMPLFIASRLKLNEKQQQWIIQTTDQFEKSGRKADVQQLVNNSIGHILLEDCYIASTENIIIKTTYTDEPLKSKCHDPKYGYLYEIKLKSEAFETQIPEGYFILNLFLDCFPKHIVSTTRDNDRIYEISQISPLTLNLLSDMLLRANFSILDSTGNEYTSASRLLALMECDNSSIVYKEFIIQCLNYFNQEANLFTVLKIGEENMIERNIELLNRNG